MFREEFFWEHRTLENRGGVFLREVGDGLLNDAASYPSRTHTLPFVNLKHAEWKTVEGSQDNTAMFIFAFECSVF